MLLMRKNGIIHSKEHASPQIKCQISGSNYLDLMSFVETLSTMLRGCSPILNLFFPESQKKVRWWKATERKILFNGCNRGLLMKRRPFNI